MITNEQITAALRKLGQPSAPTAIANELKSDPAQVGYRLRAMAEEKSLLASGKGRGRVYALPDQKLAGAPPQKGKPRRRKKSKAPAARAAAVRFIPVVDVEKQLHIINGSGAVSFDTPQTEAIATLLAQHWG